MCTLNLEEVAQETPEARHNDNPLAKDAATGPHKGDEATGARGAEVRETQSNVGKVLELRRPRKEEEWTVVRRRGEGTKGNWEQHHQDEHQPPTNAEQTTGQGRILCDNVVEFMLQQGKTCKVELIENAGRGDCQMFAIRDALKEKGRTVHIDQIRKHQVGWLSINLDFKQPMFGITDNAL